MQRPTTAIAAQLIFSYDIKKRASSASTGKNTRFFFRYAENISIYCIAISKAIFLTKSNDLNALCINCLMRY
jgi:hypothetical protein